MSTLPKATYRLNVIPIEISMAFFLEIGKNTKDNLGFWFFLIFRLFFFTLGRSSQIKEYLGNSLEVFISWYNLIDYIFFSYFLLFGIQPMRALSGGSN